MLVSIHVNCKLEIFFGLLEIVWAKKKHIDICYKDFHPSHMDQQATKCTYKLFFKFENTTRVMCSLLSKDCIIIEKTKISNVKDNEEIVYIFNDVPYIQEVYFTPIQL